MGNLTAETQRRGEVRISLTLAETEALVYFIAERKELWERAASDFGVKDAECLPRELVLAHARAIGRESAATRRAA